MDVKKAYSLIETYFTSQSAICVMSSNLSFATAVLPSLLSLSYEMKSVIGLPTKLSIQVHSEYVAYKFPGISIHSYDSHDESIPSTSVTYLTNDELVKLLLKGCPFDVIFATHYSIIPYWYTYRNDVRLVFMGSIPIELPFEIVEIDLRRTTARNIGETFKDSSSSTILKSVQSEHTIIIFDNQFKETNESIERHTMIADNIFEIIADRVEVIIDRFKENTITYDQVDGMKKKIHPIDRVEYNIRKDLLLDGGKYIRMVQNIPEANLVKLNEYKLAFQNLEYPVSVDISNIPSQVRDTYVQLNFDEISVDRVAFLSYWLDRYSLIEGIILMCLIEMGGRSYFETFDQDVVRNYYGKTILHTYYELWLTYVQSIGYNPIIDKTPRNDSSEQWLKQNLINIGRWKKMIILAKTCYERLFRIHGQKVLLEDIESFQVVDRAISILTDVYRDHIYDCKLGYRSFGDYYLDDQNHKYYFDPYILDQPTEQVVIIHYLPDNHKITFMIPFESLWTSYNDVWYDEEQEKKFDLEYDLQSNLKDRIPLKTVNLERYSKFKEYNGMYQKTTKGRDSVRIDSIQKYIHNFELNLPLHIITQYNVVDAISDSIADGSIRYPSLEKKLKSKEDYVDSIRTRDLLESTFSRYMPGFDDRPLSIKLEPTDKDADNLIEHFVSESHRKCKIEGKNSYQYWTAYAHYIARDSIKYALDHSVDIDESVLFQSISKLNLDCEYTSITANLAIFNFLKPASVLDVYSSWGERALAALLSEDVKLYYGIDMDLSLSSVYQNIDEFIHSKNTSNKEISLKTVHNYFSTDINYPTDSFDLVMIDSSRFRHDYQGGNTIHLINHFAPYVGFLKYLIIYDSTKNQRFVGSSGLFDDVELRYLGGVRVEDQSEQNKYFHIWQRIDRMDIPDNDFVELMN